MSDDVTPKPPDGSRYGFLYILSNPQMPGVVKVGQTERHPRVRAAELSSHNGVPVPFEVEYFYEVTDRVAAEQKVVGALGKFRISTGREFYAMSPSAARDLVEEAAAAFITGSPGTPTRRVRFIHEFRPPEE